MTVAEDAWPGKDVQYRMHPAHTAGAGRNDGEAAAPALVELPGTGRVLVFGFGMESSDVGRDWAAARGRPGVNRPDDLSGTSADAVARQVGAMKRARRRRRGFNALGQQLGLRH